MAALMSLFHHLPWVTIFGLLVSHASTIRAYILATYMSQLNPIFFFTIIECNTISFMVFISPIPTFYRIYKKKSTQGFQSIPYIVALFSSMLWIFYALITPNSTFLKTINCFGCFIEIVYISIFLLYATKQSRILTLKLIFMMNVGGFGSVLFMALVIAKTTQVRMKILGWICLIFSLSVFAAPLGVMRQVIRTKSVKYMPFLLSFFLTISAVMWFFYGILRKDYYVAIPNVLGFSFGVVQMVLYTMYRKSSESTEDLIEELKIPSELATNITDHQIIEVIKLGPNEMLSSIEPPHLSVIANNDNSNNTLQGNEDMIYAIEIRNVNPGMIETIKNFAVKEVETAPKLITVAT